MMAVPGAIPVTTPEALTLARAGVDVLQTPPGVLSDNVVVDDTQAAIVPVIGLTDGKGVTVKTDGESVAVVAVPFGVVTEICPVVAAAGSVAVICVLLPTVKAEGVPLNVTAVAPVKLVPVMVTEGVVPAQAEVCENPLMDGPAE